MCLLQICFFSQIFFCGKKITIFGESILLRFIAIFQSIARRCFWTKPSPLPSLLLLIYSFFLFASFSFFLTNSLLMKIKPFFIILLTLNSLLVNYLNLIYFLLLLQLFHIIEFKYKILPFLPTFFVRKKMTRLRIEKKIRTLLSKIKMKLLKW